MLLKRQRKCGWLSASDASFKALSIHLIALLAKEDDILRCEQCGGWKMKAAKCRICRLAAGFEEISVKYWTGNATMERPYDEQAPLY
jgi:hypothetical protein